MAEDHRLFTHGSLPYDLDGQIIELLWTRLRVAVQFRVSRRMPDTLAQSAGALVPRSVDLERLSALQLQELLAVLQHDIVRVEAALRTGQDA